MGRLVYGMMMSLDGYISPPEGGPEFPAPEVALHEYFNEVMRNTASALYGRRMYEVMRYWDGGHSMHPPHHRGFAEAWQAAPKYVVSTQLSEVGPNATLVRGDLRGAVEEIIRTHDGEIEVAGPTLAGALSAMGLIDEYRLHMVPLVFGGGERFFADGRVPELEFAGSEILPGNVPMLRYVRT